jgi:hypothetical protein
MFRYNKASYTRFHVCDALNILATFLSYFSSATSYEAAQKFRTYLCENYGMLEVSDLCIPTATVAAQATIFTVGSKFKPFLSASHPSHILSPDADGRRDIFWCME